ncbi:MAG: hypothetical protein ISR65_16930 [Bacteriovoracaceae bacterium]|nr:hypothetical protein [Bacteriovoracaceae bacterium]
MDDIEKRNNFFIERFSLKSSQNLKVIQKNIEPNKKLKNPKYVMKLYENGKTSKIATFNFFLNALTKNLTDKGRDITKKLNKIFSDTKGEKKLNKK